MSLLLPPQGSDLRGLFSPIDLIDPKAIQTVAQANAIAAAMRAADPTIQSVNFIAKNAHDVLLLSTDGTTAVTLWVFGTLADAGLAPAKPAGHLSLVGAA
jgi:hypothetical protein